MSLDISNELVHVANRIRELASRNHIELRRSARVAEEEERRYEQILERANEAERLRVRNLQLQNELDRVKGIAQVRATEVTRLRNIMNNRY
jgi:Mn-dependent DtxR family transcriptional regulator